MRSSWSRSDLYAVSCAGKPCKTPPSLMKRTESRRYGQSRTFPRTSTWYALKYRLFFGSRGILGTAITVEGLHDSLGHILESWLPGGCVADM